MNIEIKVGRHNYTITENDRFMDNGSSCMLITQKNGVVCWGTTKNTRLSKKVLEKLVSKYKKVRIENRDHYGGVEYFSLSIK